MNLKKILIMWLAFFAMIGTVFSAGGSLNIILSSQNPDPVSPGNFVYLNVKVSNSGVGSSDNIILNFEENNYFKIASGEDISKDLGVIPGYSFGITASNFVIAKYKVKVSDKAQIGLNTLTFSAKVGTNIYTYDFQVLVEDKNLNLIINSLNIEPIEAGKSNKLKLELFNPNSISLNDVEVSLAFDQVTPTNSLGTTGGSNLKTFDVINPGEKKIIEFDLQTTPSAISQPYLLPINIKYKDSLDNNFTKTILSSVKVFSKPLLTLKLSSQDSYSIGNSKINLAIANPGTSTIKGTQVEILDSKDYDVLKGGFEYIGNLNPDDFQTMQSQIYFKSNKNFNLKVKVNYLDSYNNKEEKIINIPIKIYSDSQLKDLGLIDSNKNSSSTTLYIVALILIVIAFYVGRRFAKKQLQKK